MPLEEENRATRACIELSVRGTLGDKAVLQKRFMELSNEGVDISFQKDDIFRRSRRLICFDMDSTLIETEVIDELADRAGVGPKCGPLPRAPCGARSTLPRVSRAASPCFGGLDVSVMEEIARNLPITEGLERLMTILKRVGYKTAILSGGFTYFGNYLKQKYGFDYVYANELEVEEGRLTGVTSARSWTAAARPSCCVCCVRLKTSTSLSRSPSATEPTTFRCSTWRDWGSHSTPSPR